MTYPGTPFTLLPTQVPRGNIRVPEADFEDLYIELMAWHDDTRLPFDPYILGVEQTLAWLADRAVAEDGKRVVPKPPLSEQYRTARPEIIIEEYLFAVEMYARPGPGHNEHVRGVIAALDWAYNGTGMRPLPVGWLAALYGYR
jgi:hypothetical protein